MIKKKQSLGNELSCPTQDDNIQLLVPFDEPLMDQHSNDDCDFAETIPSIGDYNHVSSQNSILQLSSSSSSSITPPQQYRRKCLLVTLIHAVILLSLISIAEPSRTANVNGTVQPSVTTSTSTTTKAATGNEQVEGIILKREKNGDSDGTSSSSSSSPGNTETETTTKATTSTTDVWFEEEIIEVYNDFDQNELQFYNDDIDESVIVIDDDEILHNRTDNINDSNDGVLIVATVDGTLAGLCKLTGHMIWKRSPNKQKSHRTMINPVATSSGTVTAENSGTTVSSSSSSSYSLDPLIYTTSTKGTSRSTDQWRTIAVPSILDGKVYLTAADDFVTTTARELVARSPFADHRGRIYTGSTVSSAVAINTDTGEIVQKVDGTMNGPATQYKGTTTDTNSDTTDQQSNIIWMGRVDHSVTISESGHIDVQFTTSELFSPNDLILGRSHQRSEIADNNGINNNFGLQGRTNNKNYLPSSSSADQQQRQQNSGTIQVQDEHGDPYGSHDVAAATITTDLSTVAITPSGHLAYLENETKNIRWVTQESFDTPVAFCMDSVTGRSCDLEIVPDAILSDASPDYVSNHFRRYFALHGDSSTSTDKDKSTQQYMYKNDGTQIDEVDDELRLEEEEEPTNIFGSLPESGQLFAMPLGVKRRRSSIHLPSSSSVAQAKWRHNRLHHNHHGTDMTRLQTVHANLYHHQNIATQYHDGYDDNVHSIDMYQHQIPCTASHPTFPRCLSNTFRSKHTHRRNSRTSGFEYLHPTDQTKERPDSAIVPIYPKYTNDERTVENFDIYDFQSLNERYNSQRLDLHRHSSNQFRQTWRQWLHPTVAFLFVVAFELGRRKRQWDADAKNAISSDNSQSISQEQQTSEHIIQVEEDLILGYGGHGTVVYRGLLDGREVAVKRMLKAYHASADREISLLIESDGHPNVVRYFLKEVRSEFVYLALELCDLSLHDLVGILRSRNDLMIVNEGEVLSSNSTSGEVFNAVKDILLQIATGVRHLHHLRIVHRDLKPANILLADTQKSKSKLKRCSGIEAMYDVFKKGYLVAKISDMGLGKQLVGQSSYGASQTNSSLRIQSHGAVSSVIGARGTVGWQAPEVMVLRGNTDSSVKSESSIRLVGESTESSSPNECTVRTSRSVDIFSLGCVFYTTLVPGSHPFGEWYEREANIMHDRSNTQPLQSISMEAFDLVGSMLNRNPKLRPTAKEVCDHPFFWEQDRKLSFLCDISDRIEMNGIVVSEQITSLSVLVERCASNVVGHDWSHDLDEDLVSNVQRFRSYNTSSVRDLLRLIRNKHHHFEELPKKLKDSFVSSVGLMIYFEMKFPKLLIHVYDVVRDSVACDDVLARKYAVRGTTRLKEKIMEYKDECRVRSSGSSVENQPIITTVVEVDLADENANGSQGTDSGCKEDESPILKTFEGINAIEVSRKETGAAVTTTESCGELQVIGYRGWYQHEEDWISGISKRRDQNLLRCRDDNKFRTRLCNHWDVSLGTTCPLKKKSKCIFAHGPIELRVKEGKRTRWGTLVDADGNCKNPKHSGGEDTYGAARSIESERKEEGKWNIKTANNLGKKKNAGRSKKQNAPYPTIEA